MEVVAVLVYSVRRACLWMGKGKMHRGKDWLASTSSRSFFFKYRKCIAAPPGGELLPATRAPRTVNSGRAPVLVQQLRRLPPPSCCSAVFVPTAKSVTRPAAGAESQTMSGNGGGNLRPYCRCRCTYFPCRKTCKAWPEASGLCFRVSCSSLKLNLTDELYILMFVSIV